MGIIFTRNESQKAVSGGGPGDQAGAGPYKKRLLNNNNKKRNAKQRQFLFAYL